MSTGPQTGDKAPDFTLPTDGDGAARLADFSGKNLILYFYPRDDTPGCTTEAIAFTGLKAEFGALNAAILGVSRDSTAKHAKFRSKHDLGIALGADEQGAACEAYGVWVEKNMYGRKSMGIERATFLIGPDGVVRNVWRKVKAPGHAEAVLEALKTA